MKTSAFALLASAALAAAWGSSPNPCKAPNRAYCLDDHTLVYCNEHLMGHEKKCEKKYGPGATCWESYSGCGDAMCQPGKPPVHTPPPVGTPPVNTPPVSTPPVNTPPPNGNVTTTTSRLPPSTTTIIPPPGSSPPSTPTTLPPGGGGGELPSTSTPGECPSPVTVTVTVTAAACPTFPPSGGNGNGGGGGGGEGGEGGETGSGGSGSDEPSSSTTGPPSVTTGAANAVHASGAMALAGIFAALFF